jgi:nicotinamide mononucleotide transporter
VIDVRQLVHAVIEGLATTRLPEAMSVALGLSYSLLAVVRTRWCWVAGGLGSAILVYLAAQARLPMQAALQIYYVLMSGYGFWHWSRDQGAVARSVSTWPLGYHAVACVATVGVSALTARWLAAGTQAAWPFLDSLTTWGSLFATWLVARVKLENWLYWIAIDAVLTFLFAAQALYFVALLSAVYLVVSVLGFMKWLKSYRSPQLAV